jgi:hypothetical protein
MFPFGSLLTQVPLILMATAYLIYFGACALNKSKEACIDTKPQENKLLYEKPDYLAAENLFFYNSSSDVKQNAAEKNSTEVLQDKYQITIHYQIPDRQFCPQYFTFLLFSRPPPVG